MTHVLVNGAAAWNTMIRLPQLPVPRSQTLFAEGYHDGLGGTSAGKALTLAALGVDVTLATVLGDDDEGDRVRDALTHERVTLLAARAAGGRTERHVNLMAADGSRVSVYLELPATLDPAPPADVLAALGTASVAVLDLAESSRPLLLAARRCGVEIWCDVHDDDGVSDYPRDFVAAADVLVASADRLADPRGYLRDAVARGAALAVVTGGSRGAWAQDREGAWEVGTAPVGEVVDANGAGDAFVAGLLAARLSGADLATALAHAAATGALAVTSTALGAPQATATQVAELANQVTVRRIP